MSLFLPVQRLARDFHPLISQLQIEPAFPAVRILMEGVPHPAFHSADVFSGAKIGSSGVDDLFLVKEDPTVRFNASVCFEQSIAEGRIPRGRAKLMPIALADIDDHRVAHGIA